MKEEITTVVYGKVYKLVHIPHIHGSCLECAFDCDIDACADIATEECCGRPGMVWKEQE